MIENNAHLWFYLCLVLAAALLWQLRETRVWSEIAGLIVDQLNEKLTDEEREEVVQWIRMKQERGEAEDV